MKSKAINKILFLSADDNVFTKKNKIIEKSLSFIILNDSSSASYISRYFVFRGGIDGIFEYMGKAMFPKLTIKQRTKHFLDILIKMELIRLFNLADMFRGNTWEESYYNVKNIRQKDLFELIALKDCVLKEVKK